MTDLVNIRMRSDCTKGNHLHTILEELADETG